MTDDIGGGLYGGWRSALAGGTLALTRCGKCHRRQWYPLVACPECMSQRWEWMPVERHGTLYSWTRVVRPTVRREGLEPPYVLGVVELPQADNARVIALAKEPADDPRIGARVELIADRLGDGTPILMFADAAQEKTGGTAEDFESGWVRG